MFLSELTFGLAAYILALAALLGAVLASFTGCAVARKLAGEDFLHGRSRCDACGHPLSAAELVPVFSWLFLRGRCRWCGAAIPARCPVTEALTAAAFCAILWRQGLTLQALESLIFTVLLLAVALTDWGTGFIPDGLLAAAIANFVLFTAVTGGVSALGRGLLGGLAASVPLLAVVLVMDKVLGRESMGGGDIKLFFTAGLYLSWREALFLLISACLLGIALSLLTRRTTGDPDNPGAFPFGPAIALAAVISLLWGAPVTAWYLRLF